jgi:hypothetical protein
VYFRQQYMTANLDKTILQYDTAFSRCKQVFLEKTKDYGTSWRILRTRSITDQLYIKAKRIRTIDETGEQKVRNTGDSIEDEFIGCVNYGIIGLIQLGLEGNKNIPLELDAQQAEIYFDQYYQEIKDLMIAKNHDYGEAWRDMRISSYTDMILARLHRIKQIEDNQGQTSVSEGIDANYKDIVNYAIFAMIQFSEQKTRI